MIVFVIPVVLAGLFSEEDTATYNIRSIEMSDTNAVTLELGNTWNDSDSGHLEVSVRDKDVFSEEDVTFISENEEIATIEYTNDLFTTTLYYEINAVSAGETYVYVKAKEGDAVSEKIHVIVERNPDTVIELEKTPEFSDIYYSIEESYIPETDVIETLVVPENKENVGETELLVQAPEPIYTEPEPEPIWTEPVQTVTIVYEDSSMTPELMEQLEGIAVFWAPTGDKTHLNPTCRSFKDGQIFHFAGTLEEAQTVRTKGWCKWCAECLFGTDNSVFYADGNSYATTEALASSYTYNDYLNGIPASAFDD